MQIRRCIQFSGKVSFNRQVIASLIHFAVPLHSRRCEVGISYSSTLPSFLCCVFIVQSPGALQELLLLESKEGESKNECWVFLLTAGAKRRCLSPHQEAEVVPTPWVSLTWAPETFGRPNRDIQGEAVPGWGLSKFENKPSQGMDQRLFFSTQAPLITSFPPTGTAGQKQYFAWRRPSRARKKVQECARMVKAGSSSQNLGVWWQYSIASGDRLKGRYIEIEWVSSSPTGISLFDKNFWIVGVGSAWMEPMFSFSNSTACLRPWGIAVTPRLHGTFRMYRWVYHVISSKCSTSGNLLVVIAFLFHLWMNSFPFQHLCLFVCLFTWALPPSFIHHFRC